MISCLPSPPAAPKTASPARSTEAGWFALHVGWYAPEKQVTITAPGYLGLTTNLGPRASSQRRLRRDFRLQSEMNSVDTGDAAAPPVVVSTVPESGAANVDPAFKEIRATFSEPMQDGSWSWTKWNEDNFPQLTGQPAFLEDGRTCVLPVRLQPGKVYALWLNSEQHQNFKNRTGLSAVPYLLIFETRK
jgi:RNA polymerase sigma-70 factor (ECF subfamily)